MSELIVGSLNLRITEARSDISMHWDVFLEERTKSNLMRFIQKRAYLAGLCKAMEYACKEASHEILYKNFDYISDFENLKGEK